MMTPNAPRDKAPHPEPGLPLEMGLLQETDAPFQRRTDWRKRNPINVGKEYQSCFGMATFLFPNCAQRLPMRIERRGCEERELK